jgi:hypothetical protein
MVGIFVVTGQPHAADVLSAFRNIRGGDFIFREDGGIRAFRYARAAVNAGVRVNIEPGPFFLRFAWNDALYRANFYTPAVAQTKAGNNVSHRFSSDR